MGMTYEEVFSQVKKIFMEADVSGEKEHPDSGSCRLF